MNLLIILSNFEHYPVFVALAKPSQKQKLCFHCSRWNRLQNAKMGPIWKMLSPCAREGTREEDSQSSEGE